MRHRTIWRHTKYALLSLAAAWAVAACSDARDDDDDDDDDGSSAQEPAELEGITQAHNDERALVGVAPLTWDPDLARVAQSWASSCTDNQAPPGLVDHNDGRSDDYPGYVGENIYGSSMPASGPAAVAAWVSEKVYYDYDSDTCSRVCGHYTQVVWAETVRLGCGYANCTDLAYSHTVVCNYSPGGNSGGRPY